jgi:L-amino acid N-acyltransferase
VSTLPTGSDQIEVRRAERRDASAIAEIYNQAVEERVFTFDRELTSSERFLPFIDVYAQCAILVADLETQIVGWASMRPRLLSWESYESAKQQTIHHATGQSSCYVRQGHRGRGTGKTLKRAQLEVARDLGFHSVIAEIVETNVASLHLNTSFGYKEVGRTVGFGTIDSYWIDLITVQLSLQ